MCGIAGGLLSSIDAAGPIGARLLDGIRWRGRDGEGVWSDGARVVFAHSRLVIVDPAGGQQPMHDARRDLTIVFNGEIYNHVELRARYEALGAVFRTRSDTEVLLEGFRLCGAAVLDDLIGMYAFAIWDARTQRLFLARDRIGKKPLHWFRHGGDFWFSSTLRSFEDLPGWSGRLSANCMRFYGAVGSFPSDRSVFVDGRTLPPGTFAWVEPGAPPRIERHWRPDYSHKDARPVGDALEEYRALLTEAIRIRLRADVPVALTFSGGVDSGSIAGLARSELGADLRCFTVDHHADDEPSADHALASAVAAHLGLDWQFVPFDYRRRLLPELEEVLPYVDQPCSQLPIVYATALYRAVRPFATVVLSGNGADELFLGYAGNEALRARDEAPRARGSRWRAWWRALARRPVPGAVDLADYQCAYVRSHLLDDDGHVPADQLTGALAAEIREAGVTNHSDLYSFMALRYFASDGNLRLPDVAGMLAQVEVRSPFLDHRMVEFAARLPTALKVGDAADGTRNKLLPKLLYEQLVPPAHVWSRKYGMGSNIRFDRSFADDPAFLGGYAEALGALGAAGIDATPYVAAHAAFVRDKQAGVFDPPSSGMVMSAFMLGRWLASRSGAGGGSHAPRVA